MLKVIFLLFCMLIINNTQAKNQFDVQGCEFIASFPGAPEITNIFSQSDPDIPISRAEFFGQNYYLRAECFSLKNNQDSALRKMLFDFGESQGLANLVLNSGSDQNGKWLLLRGNKKVGKENTTYEIKNYIGERTFLSIYAGAYSNIYPTDEISNFLRGVTLK